MAKSLTAANAVIMLGVTGLYSVPQQIQGFSADDVFDTDAVESAETMAGVDGKLSGGWVYVPRKQNITLQADSDSNEFFENWAAAQDAARELYYGFGLTSLPSLNRAYTMVKGILTSTTPTPSAKKVLQPRKYTITWERLTPAPI